MDLQLPKTEFDNVIGYETVKEDLKKICKVLKHPEWFRDFGVRQPSGLLLFGKPGLGKTLMAECFIRESGLTVYECRKDESGSDFVGKIKATFEEAEAKSQETGKAVIVFLDDLDKFANNDYENPDAEEFVTVQSCMDSARKKGVFTLATVNDISRLPSSLIRSGRMDRTIQVEPPRGQDAEAVVRYYLKGKPVDPAVDAKVIARILTGRTCADLETAINEAGILAGCDLGDQIEMEHLVKACLKTVFHMDCAAKAMMGHDWYPGKENDNGPDADGQGISREEIAYHEAGHVLAGELLIPGSVTLALLNHPAGKAGGMTLFYDESHEGSRRFGEVSAIRGLGGIAAEEHRFGQCSRGTSSDRDMVRDQLRGLIGDEGIRGLCFDGRYLHISSDRKKERLETAIDVEMERLLAEARVLIATHHDLLEKLAQALLQKEMLLSSDISQVMRSDGSKGD